MMPNTAIVSHDLDKARRDLDDAGSALSAYYAETFESDAVARLASAAEALMRAVASVVICVDRLAALPACDGGHD